jgi:hypothetical protein
MPGTLQGRITFKEFETLTTSLSEFIAFTRMPSNEDQAIADRDNKRPFRISEKAFRFHSFMQTPHVTHR